MNPQTRNEVQRALRERAEADKLLGALAWPVPRRLLRRAAAAPPAPHAEAHRPPAMPPATAPAADAAARASANAPPTVVRAPASPAGSAAGASQAISPAECARRKTALDVLNASQVRGCTRCGLAATRTQTVFGQGSVSARLVFVGEAPGFEEDRTGLAFVGRAGQLLTLMIERGMGLRRDDVFICNVLKCRPPENRQPAPDEIAACSPFLFEQLRLLQPEVIVALGAPAAQTLLNTRDPIGRLRGRFHDFRPGASLLSTEPAIPLMPTYHPAYLLRNPADKVKAWQDLKLVLQRLGLPVPATGA